MTTPDYLTHAAERLVDLDTDDHWVLTGAGRNMVVLPERLSAGAVADEGCFVQPGPERQALYNGGQFRELDVQFLFRFRRDNWASGWALACGAYDLLHLSGAFVAADLTAYLDVRAIDAPTPFEGIGNEPVYFALNVSLWKDQ